MSPWRKDNPYPKHTFHHFYWNVYHLLVYQFSRYAVAAWIILVLAVAWGFHSLQAQNDKLQRVDTRTRILITQNHQRINDIQRDRLRSCITTYTVIQNLFRPLYPPKNKRTAKQQAGIDKFEAIFTTKIKRCVKQTGVHHK